MTELGMQKQYCEWYLDDDESNAWASGCGEMWYFEDGNPEDNGMKYCPFCGRHSTQRPSTEYKDLDDTYDTLWSFSHE